MLKVLFAQQGRGLSFVTVALAGLVLSACSSAPVKPSIQRSASVGGADSASGAPRTDAPYGWEPVKEGGGYYLDDGPGAKRPVNLASMPDPVPDIEPINKSNTRPYTVMGQTFRPQTSLDQPYKERGRASWYGRKFHGAKTANGEIYDMYQMTAAHPTLPLPCYAKVTNLSNGRSVIVRVNDRGPFLKGRIIDLSYAAALKLDYIKHGSAEVEVEKLTPDLVAQYRAKDLANQKANQVEVAKAEPVKAIAAVSATAVDPAQILNSNASTATAGAMPASDQNAQASDNPVADAAPTAGLAKPVVPVSTQAQAGKGMALAPKASSGNVFLQMGAFGQEANAQAMKNEIINSNAELGKSTTVLMKSGLYRVIVGPFANVDQANDAAIELTSNVSAKPVIKEDLILP